MQLRDIIIALIALILAVFVFQLLWTITAILIKIIIFLIVAYIVYLFLKKLL